MADFDKAIKFINQNEGGYVNDPDDPGGATKFGISLRFLKTLGEYGDFDGDGDIDVDDIKLMSQEDADGIYKRFWWDKYRYGLIKDQEVATKIFDFSINMGASRAHKISQESVNLLPNFFQSANLPLIVDGILGDKTLSEINKAMPERLMVAIMTSAASFYRSLVVKNPTFKKYIDGWIKRAYRRYN
jgi:lysozyme family protein